MSDVSPQVTPIAAGFVNCYLLRSGGRFVLIDTGLRSHRAPVERAIADAGCSAGELALIIATHGDPDHIGNCAYLREKLGAKVGMHRLEAPVAETGDLAAARPNVHGVSKDVFGSLGWLFSVRKADRFTPDVYLEDGDDLADYGLDAKVFLLPGHSAGSISVLTANGDLFCGDLMANSRKPEANTLADDRAQILASVERARELGARTVYPGHGRPFAMSDVAPGADASG